VAARTIARHRGIPCAAAACVPAGAFQEANLPGLPNTTRSWCGCCRCATSIRSPDVTAPALWTCVRGPAHREMAHGCVSGGTTTTRRGGRKMTGALARNAHARDAGGRAAQHRRSPVHAERARADSRRHCLAPAASPPRPVSPGSRTQRPRHHVPSTQNPRPIPALQAPSHIGNSSAQSIWNSSASPLTIDWAVGAVALG
jgi:hypothetical protein